MWRIGAAMSGAESAGGRDLVEQRLEHVVVAAVDDRDLDVVPPQHARRRQPAEAAAQDHDARSRFRHETGILCALTRGGCTSDGPSIELLGHER